ncbi:MAG TPA: hypothetical protein VKU61_13355 [Candidatus Binatia bacterium]|nr:hypothetical protein [Candidatus Binatia bacterium]
MLMDGRWIVAAALAGSIVSALPGDASARTRIVQALSPTAHAPGARGTAKLVMPSGSKGRFSIKARHLAGDTSFDVVVNKVKVGTLATGPGGSGIARFSTSPRGRSAMLGFDPRGAEIEVRDADSGDDDLDTDMPDDHPDSAIGCCLGENDDDQGDEEGDHGETECHELTAAECGAKGGTATTATSCLPNPCGQNPPPSTTVCCLAHDGEGESDDDDPEVECEHLSSSDCAAGNGTTVQATSCDPNPCLPVPPPQLVICCVPDDGESECERLTPDHCTAAKGTASTATSCDPDPCGTGGDGGDD